MKTVILISCSKLKRSYSCEARLLYDKSSLFNKSYAYAQIITDEIFIISAKHGLVSLTDIVDPYDETLSNKPYNERMYWGKTVADQLLSRFDNKNTQFIILAGQNYCNPLLPYLSNIVLPLNGLQLESRMAKLDALIKHIKINQNDNFMCARIHQLFNGMTRFKWDEINNIDFNNGIYIIFEVGEKYNGMDRIVRVGTHISSNRLQQRLKDHFIKENKDGSIFRKNIGKAILNKNNHPYLRIWNVDTSKPENIDKLESAYDPAIQIKIEKAVTKYMREHFSFICFPVATSEERLRLEEGIIATINNAVDFSASPDWRGRYSTENEIIKSGLWLKQGLNGIPLSEKEYEIILSLCSKNHDYSHPKQQKSSLELENVNKQPPDKKTFNTIDIVNYLIYKMNHEKKNGSTSIIIKSGDIHKELNLKSRVPMVCSAMRKLMKTNDVCLYQPPKGNGTTLTIMYNLD